ncbi:MAG TPA: hypothetical protein VFS60_13695, partial [Thermoanaerobaculia bacterium]|nr:hypothetical protein [Thermoanaerobaculia bacterium]
MKTPHRNARSRSVFLRSFTLIAVAVELLCAPGGELAAQLVDMGLTVEGAQWFDNDYPTSAGNASEGFGLALVAGDFDGDGVEDLATGVPNEVAAVRAGAVVVRYGSRGGGLSHSQRTLILRQETQWAESGDSFGRTIAAGDFNGDSFDDLAVGIPYKGTDDRGAVRMYYGSVGGLSVTAYELLDEIAAGGAACNGAQFGGALAAGNFDADLYADLAIAAPGSCEGGSGQRRGGAVYVAHGTSEGLAPFFGYRISEDSPGIFDQVENGDLFGGALATGDFDADGYDDLAIGVPGENDLSGAIDVVMGSPWGLIFVDSVFWYPGAL